MDAVRIALMLLAAALACATMRVHRPDLAVGVALAAGAAALVLVLPGLRTAADTLARFAQASGLEDGAALILRATGISLIAEFAARLCEDAGEKALAGRVELVVRVALFAMAAPLLVELLDTITEAFL